MPDVAVIAAEILRRLPASIEMPAGTGKTEIVTALAAIGAERGHRTLILTHTHAGIDAVRRRLRKFEVPSQKVHVDTIAGWAFSLVRSYPMLAGIAIPAEPDWSRSAEYVLGAVKVLKSPAISRVHRLSFEYLVVDEYQDCVTSQHDFVVSMAVAIPKTCILGDRLQGIFGFKSGEDLVQWDANLALIFPPFVMQHTPWRWAQHNSALGEWLVGIRPTLLAKQPLQIDSTVPGLTWQFASPSRATLVAEASRLSQLGGSVLIVGKWSGDCAAIASKVYGFGVMEELEGKFIEKFLRQLEISTPEGWAAHLVVYAKSCFVGLAGLNEAIIGKLTKGESVGHLKRDGFEEVLQLLDDTLQEPTHGALAEVMDALERVSGLRLYRREAWRETKRVLSSGADSNGESPVAHLAKVRDHLRRVGRPPGNRVVSRTLLVKGLEYDHVIIADADTLENCENLYVALSRARTSVTVFSKQPVVQY